MGRFDQITPGLLAPYTNVEQVDTSVTDILDYEFQGPEKIGMETTEPALAAFDASGTVPVVTTDGSGTGAIVSSITVNSEGSITAVTFSTRGSGYAAGDLMILTQGGVTGNRPIRSGNLTPSGGLNNLGGVTISHVFTDAAQAVYDKAKAAYDAYLVEPLEGTRAIYVHKRGSGDTLHLYYEPLGQPGEHVYFPVTENVLLERRVTKIWEDDGLGTPVTTTSIELIIDGLY